MNPQWNTPPNGDFASYVERLSAQAALPRRAPEDGEHSMAAGMTPSDDTPGMVTAAARRRNLQSNGAPVVLSPADLVRKLLSMTAQGLRAWAEEAARKPSTPRSGKKK